MTTKALYEIRCQYCFKTPVEHNPACPEVVRTDQAMEDWQKGFCLATNAIVIADLTESEKNNATLMLGFSTGVATWARRKIALGNL